MTTPRRTVLLLVLSAVAAVYSLLPIYNLFSLSFMDGSQLVRHFLFPPTPNLGNYLRLFGLLPFQEAAQVRQGLANSVVVALSVMAVTMAVAVPAGYALGRLQMKGRGLILGVIIGTRMLPPITILLPYYFFFKAIHLWGTIPGLVIIQMSITVPVVAWVLVGFFGALPRDIEMSARMDGCTRFQAFRRAL
ncbi:MAG: carbohydrate ABC transporter permease, partial [Nitrososphaerota archaeon]|nr:carbohydrate ABC transporter permease [Nitrososphaerota archaeon]